MTGDLLGGAFAAFVDYGVVMGAPFRPLTLLGPLTVGGTNSVLLGRLSLDPGFFLVYFTDFGGKVAYEPSLRG